MGAFIPGTDLYLFASLFPDRGPLRLQTDVLLTLLNVPCFRR
jgi:hypothetical protein